MKCPGQTLNSGGFAKHQRMMTEADSVLEM